MDSVVRVDERLKGMPWPVLQRGWSLRFDEGDVLILCGGFEERATAVLGAAVAAGSRRFAAYAVEYSPFIQENRVQELGALCLGADASFATVAFSRISPEGGGERLLARVPPASRVVIDVSGMSRLLVVQVVAAALRSLPGCQVFVAYSEAQVYPPTFDEYQKRRTEEIDPLGMSMFLSSGVLDLTVVPELSSVAMQGQPIRAVIFPSWNPAQLSAVLAELQASFFTVVHGLPPNPEAAWRLEALRHLNRVDALPSSHEVTVSTLDYRETLSMLLDVYASHSVRERLVVVPTGSKMQAGVAC